MPGSRLERDVVQRDQRSDAHQLLLVDARDRGADRGRQCGGWTDLRTNEQEDVVERVLRERNIELDEILRLVGTPLHLARDTHDFSNLDQA